MHDRNGKLLKVGDTVNVPCVIKSISTSATLCNCSLETVEKMDPSRTTGESITLNCRQTELVESAE